MKNNIYTSFDKQKTLFSALLDAGNNFGKQYKIIEDINRQPISYRKIILRSILLSIILKKQTNISEHIGIIFPNTIALSILFFALQFIGRVPAMLNFTSGSFAIKRACQTAQIKTIYTSKTFIKKANLEKLIEELRKKYKIFYIEDIKEKINLKSKILAFFIYLNVDRYYNKKSFSKKSELSAVILFTSGSEGYPKGVVLSHKNLLSNFAQVKQHIEFGASNILFCCLPLYHSFGLNAGFLMPLFGGSKVFLYPTPLDYRIIPKLIYELKATILFGTNTFFKGYASYANSNDFKTLKYIVAGAEKLHKDTISLWREKFNLTILQGYGVTETSPVISVNNLNKNKEGTVGSIMDGMNHYIKVVEGIKKGGHLVVKGPNIMLGYLLHDKPGEIQPPSTEKGPGWYDTGDIAEVDEEGFLTILGRAKRFAKIGGEMVSLTAVEELAALTWPEIKHASISFIDKKNRERIILVTENKKANHLELQKIAKKNQISELTIPKKIITTIEIPILATGKIDYVNLEMLVRSKINGENVK